MHIAVFNSMSVFLRHINMLVLIFCLISIPERIKYLHINFIPVYPPALVTMVLYLVSCDKFQCSHKAYAHVMHPQIHKTGCASWTCLLHNSLQIK